MSTQYILPDVIRQVTVHNGEIIIHGECHYTYNDGLLKHLLSNSKLKETLTRPNGEKLYRLDSRKPMNFLTSEDIGDSPTVETTAPTVDKPQQFNQTEKVFLKKFRNEIDKRVAELRVKRDNFIAKSLEGAAVPANADSIIGHLSVHDTELAQFEADIQHAEAMMGIIWEMVKD